MPQPNRIAVVEMTSADNVDENLACAEARIAQAASFGAGLVSLPECFAFLGTSDEATMARAEPLDGPWLAQYAALAQKHGVWLSLGGFPEARSDLAPDAGYSNTHVLIDAEGQVTASYRKIHLFDVDVPGGPRLRESRLTRGGDAVVLADSPAGKLGLTICYDVRFPGLFQTLRDQGADVLLVPAAFTLMTGKDHWEVLLRARAIETQCYVAAAAQSGRHNAKRQSYGNALIIDPWGAVVARTSPGNPVAVADINTDYAADIRTRLPVWNHRRPDIYG